MLKINDIQHIGAVNAYKKDANFKQTGAHKKEMKKDEVQISSEAKELLGAQDAQEASRSQKIEELKKSVASGTYHVESGKIAEKMLPYLGNPQK